MSRHRENLNGFTRGILFALVVTVAPLACDAPEGSEASGEAAESSNWGGGESSLPPIETGGGAPETSEEPEGSEPIVEGERPAGETGDPAEEETNPEVSGETGDEPGDPVPDPETETGTESVEGSPEGGDETGNGEEPEAPANDSAFLSQVVPTAVTAGEEFAVELVFVNVGTAVWSKEQMHFLGSWNPMDNFTWGTNRIPMDAAVTVAPGETVVFSDVVLAPDAPGTYFFEWRMLQDAVEWFGESTPPIAIEVVAPPDEQPDDPPSGGTPFDLNNVTWLHTDVSGWEVTATLSSVEVVIGKDEICLQYDKAGVWPEVLYNPEKNTWVVANPWVFIEKGGQWYAGTWEWLRPNQTCKAAHAVSGEYIKQSPFDLASGWVPESGEKLYFMVSGLARDPAYTNVSERSNLVEVIWP